MHLRIILITFKANLQTNLFLITLKNNSYFRLTLRIMFNYSTLSILRTLLGYSRLLLKIMLSCFKLPLKTMLNYSQLPLRIMLNYSKLLFGWCLVILDINTNNACYLKLPLRMMLSYSRLPLGMMLTNSWLSLRIMLSYSRLHYSGWCLVIKLF